MLILMKLYMKDLAASEYAYKADVGFGQNAGESYAGWKWKT